MTVVAEGVEEAWQQDLLAQQGCQNLQGFHFARPMPIEDLTAFMAAGKRASTGLCRSSMGSGPG